MKTSSYSITKIASRAALGLLLCAGLAFPAVPAQAAQTTQVSGSADVILSEVLTQSSTGASAQASIQEKNQATLQADLTLPGSWAEFTIVAENRGQQEARLSQVLQHQDMPENVSVSFGVSDTDAGETLGPGEQCEVSVVVEADPEETESFDESGSFSLTLIYDADEEEGGTESGTESGDGTDEESPQTGDSFPVAAAGAAVVAALACVYFWNRKKHASEAL